MPSGLAESYLFPPSPQVNTGHTDICCGLPTLLNVTDITNSRVESHSKATRLVIGELLKVNTANWLAFPLKYEVFDNKNGL